MGLKLSYMMIGIIFYESLITPPDTLNPKNKRMEEMRVDEFLVFICRITHEHYKQTPYKDEKLYIKLDKMLPIWLSPVYATPDFVLGCEFEYDIKK